MLFTPHDFLLLNQASLCDLCGWPATEQGRSPATQSGSNSVTQKICLVSRLHFASVAHTDRDWHQTVREAGPEEEVSCCEMIRRHIALSSSPVAHHMTDVLAIHRKCIHRLTDHSLIFFWPSLTNGVVWIIFSFDETGRLPGWKAHGTCV